MTNTNTNTNTNLRGWTYALDDHVLAKHLHDEDCYDLFDNDCRDDGHVANFVANFSVFLLVTLLY